MQKKINRPIISPLEIDIDLPCTKLVKHFLEIRYGTPVQFKSGDIIGQLFYCLIGKHQDHFKSQCVERKHQIKIRITENIIFRHGVIISESNMRIFERAVRSQIKEEICLFMNASIKQHSISNPSQRFFLSKLIDRYVQENNFDPEIFNTEFIKKTIQRKQKKELSHIYN